VKESRTSAANMKTELILGMVKVSTGLLVVKFVRMEGVLSSPA